MSNEDPNGIAVKALTFNGQRYIRLADVADLLRGFANALEPGIIVDAKEVANELRIIARQLEQP
jgi:hypothetical protein